MLLSVKHVNARGQEIIVLATEVRADKETPIPGRLPTKAWGRVQATLPSGSLLGFGDGSVFVMNDTGKTISRYDFQFKSEESEPEDE